MKNAFDNPLFLSALRPALAAVFWIVPIAFVLQTDALSDTVNALFLGTFSPLTDIPVLGTAGAIFLIAFIRTTQALQRLRARAGLAGFPLCFLSAEKLLKQYRKFPAGSVYLGRGFAWTPELADTAYRITEHSVDAGKIPSRIRLLLTGTRGKNPRAIGQSWLHGIGPKEAPVLLTEKAADGGTLIVGTTQSGKGVLLTLLISEAIFRGETVIIIDPKNSPRTLQALKKAAELAGRDSPYVFHPASQTGVRMNLLSHFARTSEIASRITWCLNETGPFVAFAWRAVYIATTLLVAARKKVTLKLLSETIALGPQSLVYQCACTCFGQNRLREQLSLSAKRNDREALVEALETLLNEDRQDATLTAPLKEGLSLLKADPDHEAKLIAGLLPLLTSLTAGPLSEALSPNADDPLRPATDLSNIISEKRILYVATDSLADSFTASAVATLLLADLASLAASRYNKREVPTRINLFIDEASNAMSEALIEILNKGAEAGIRTTCAMQTVSDLTARLKSEAAARMALGNFNTLIALRTKDLETARFAIETFGQTKITSRTCGLVTQSTSDAPGRFSAGFTRRETAERKDLLEASWLGRLPNTEYFACLAGASLIKGRVPIITTEHTGTQR